MSTARPPYRRRRKKKAAAKPKTASLQAALDPHDEHRFAVINDRTVDAVALEDSDVDVIRDAAREGRLRCPVCGDRMVAKLGETVKWHFAHRSDARYSGHEPESDPHKKAKAQLMQWAADRYPGAECRNEWRLPAIRQIADAMVAPVGRRPIALEIQYADLSAPSWRKRHGGYQSAGIDDLWVLGHTRLRTKGKTQVTLDTLCSTMLAANHPLIYLNPAKGGIVTVVTVGPALMFADRRGERLGTVPATITKHPLSAMRLDGSSPYFVERFYQQK